MTSVRSCQCRSCLKVAQAPWYSLKGTLILVIYHVTVGVAYKRMSIIGAIQLFSNVGLWRTVCNHVLKDSLGLY